MAVDEPALSWVRRVTGCRRLDVVRNLPGSSTGSLDVLLLGGPRRPGIPEQVVLRRYVKPALVERHPDLAAREAQALAAAAGCGLAVPDLLGVDPAGAAVGVPAVLMSLLDGRPRLRPRSDPDRGTWVDGLVRALVAVHRTDPPAAGSVLEPIGPWFDPETLTVPGWARDPAPWQALFAELRERPRPTSAEPVLVHRDLHPGNVLWVGSRVTGVVDWVNAGTGSPAADLARCRTNLAVLTGETDADEVLGRYRERTGRGLVDQRWWDLADLGGAATISLPGMSMLDSMVGGASELGVAVSREQAVVGLETHLSTVLAG